MPCALMCHHLLWALSQNMKAPPLPATGAPRARKRTEAGLASPPPIAQARRGGPGSSPIRPCIRVHQAQWVDHPLLFLCHPLYRGGKVG